jgi:two-component system response regulator ChvI
MNQPATAHILFVEDDPLFRKTISQNLLDAGFSVSEFESSEMALDYLRNGGHAHLALLNWGLPSLSGMQLFERMRGEKFDLPIIFLTLLNDQVYEETALMTGAADFIDKSRSFSVILSRINSVLNGSKIGKGAFNLRPSRPQQEPPTSRYGSLILHTQSNRALWDGKRVNLTLAEFKIVRYLASEMGRDVPHREIYDIVRGPGFLAGDGENGYRSNVRTFIKRIRRKFTEVDPNFDRIATYSGFGYRWVNEERDVANNLVPAVAAMNVPEMKEAAQGSD